jgi:hypothetical protein
MAYGFPVKKLYLPRKITCPAPGPEQILGCSPEPSVGELGPYSTLDPIYVQP